MSRRTRPLLLITVMYLKWGKKKEGKGKKIILILCLILPIFMFVTVLHNLDAHDGRCLVLSAQCSNVFIIRLSNN